MSITHRPPDLEADISFLATSDGGRRSAAHSGYRPDHNFGVRGTLNGAAHEYVGQNSVEPGETARANLWLLAPECQQGRLQEGFAFTVQEGPRVVGNGVIRKVLNASLRANA
jgi:translation elongation factor EF-Tu-like GTPase